MVFLKYLSQVLLLAGGVMSFWWDTHKTTSGGRKKPSVGGWITIAAFLTGFILFFVTDRSEQKEKVQKDAQQQQQIAYLKQLYFKQNISEVEISFKPSAEHWSRIDEAYKNTHRLHTLISYDEAPMTAERMGGYWRIKFEEVKRPAGLTQFEPVDSNKPDGNGFEDVIREAMKGLWIKWGDSVETVLRPRIEDYYPSAIAISQDRIAYILRPPAIVLSISSLTENPNLILRGGENPPSKLRFHSLDPSVMFDQTFDMNWREEVGTSIVAKMFPYISGPHRLKIKFKTDPS